MKVCAHGDPGGHGGGVVAAQAESVGHAQRAIGFGEGGNAEAWHPGHEASRDEGVFRYFGAGDQWQGHDPHRQLDLLFRLHLRDNGFGLFVGGIHIFRGNGTLAVLRMGGGRAKRGS